MRDVELPSDRQGRSRKGNAPPFALVTAIGIVTVVVVAGCGQLAHRLTTRAPEKFVPNPIELPHASDEFVWSQVVDAVDDYFRIAREQPVQNRSELVLDGRIETAYQIGGSIFEPWRKDSTAGFERLQSTLQTIRRRAIITVRPRPRGYTLEVVVQKDLEDTDRSQYSTESTASRRHDGTVVRQEDRYADSPVTLGWIPLGRDASLEQVILRDIFERVTTADASRHH